MPYLHIQTNQSLSANQEQSILQAFETEVAEALGKSRNYVMTAIESGTSMRFAGSSGTSAFLQLKSLGLSGDQTKSLSARLTVLASEQLGVPPERIYIQFEGPERAMWGFNGGTFG